MFVSRGANNIQLDSHPRRARLPPTQTHPLDAELGAAPVATLGVVTDGVTGAHADPLGDGAVLLLLLPQDLLGLEGLLGRLLAKGEDGAKVRKPRLGWEKRRQTLIRDAGRMGARAGTRGVATGPPRRHFARLSRRRGPRRDGTPARGARRRPRGGFPAENPAANANIPRCGPAVWTRGDAGPRVASTRASRRARPRVFG